MPDVSGPLSLFVGRRGLRYSEPSDWRELILDGRLKRDDDIASKRGDDVLQRSRAVELPELRRIFDEIDGVEPEPLPSAPSPEPLTQVSTAADSSDPWGPPQSAAEAAHGIKPWPSTTAVPVASPSLVGPMANPSPRPTSRDDAIRIHVAAGASSQPSAGGAAKKSNLVAYVFWFLLSGLGGHNFYLGRTTPAVGQLLLFTVGWLTAGAGIGAVLLVAWWVWVIVDAFLIPGVVKRHNRDLSRRSVRRRTLTDTP